jgi:hypothetical protein
MENTGGLGDFRHPGPAASAKPRTSRHRCVFMRRGVRSVETAGRRRSDASGACRGKGQPVLGPDLNCSESSGCMSAPVIAPLSRCLRYVDLSPSASSGHPRDRPARCHQVLRLQRREVGGRGQHVFRADVGNDRGHEEPFNACYAGQGEVACFPRLVSMLERPLATDLRA